MMKKTFISVLIALFFCVGAANAQQNAAVYLQAIESAIADFDYAKIEKTCIDWNSSGQYSEGVVQWNFNALMSVEPDALLIVASDEELFSLWMIQKARKIQTQVKVMSYASFQKKSYREFVQQYQQVRLLGNDQAEMLQNLLKTANPRPIYLGVMLDPSIIQQEKENLYLTGLALRLSQTPFENISLLKKHYEEDFLLDYLKYEMPSDPAYDQLAALNMNYLPAFLLLYRYYSDQGNSDAAENLREISMKIARAGNREQEVSDLMQPTVFAKPGNISPKLIEKGFKKVNPKLWAAATETTNEQYERFLTDLLKNKEYRLLDECKIPKTNWRALLPDSLSQVSDERLFKFGHPDGHKMPVQQISYEAAVQYCNWLTATYNAATEKKKFKKVIFRLPTEIEWMAAARGNKEETPYPWGMYFVRNSKGCYLLNMYATEPCATCEAKIVAADGGYFTVEAATYFPNSLGLYNMSGNVAEMISEKGKTKGGSWAESAFQAQISQSGIYAGPSPSIGFRVFMEIIEE